MLGLVVGALVGAGGVLALAEDQEASRPAIHCPIDARQIADEYAVSVLVARDACAGSSAPASRAALAAVDYLQRGAVTTVDRLAEAYAVAAAA